MDQCVLYLSVHVGVMALVQKITSASGHTRSNVNLAFDETNHEEADTKQRNMASTRDPADAKITIFSTDTDVPVL